MKEYGSNIQKLTDYIGTLPDREQRTRYAHILIELMRQIHPNMREGIDYSKKLWDDLYVMANFDLDVDSPFPPPPKEILGKKPMTVPYNQHQLKHRLYGRNLELLVLKAMITPELDDRKAFISYMVRLMKSFYQVWNKDTIETAECLQQILELSGFKLQQEIDELRRDGLMESSPRDGSSNRQRSQQNQGQNGGGHQFRDNRGDNRDNRNNRNDRNDRNKNFGNNGNYKNNKNNNNRRPR
ncbi:hypothetical protein Emtol_3157 [Emticicia oligotrophica DSM 17448]|uniref:DUF4290 domain-containing protein n=1 Tax=Emticicia oligotrophica (strain DSM 17448 / CIP 109782 / MTCC 6937 / GPTSA100-15) TaxID=929562 RepID=A0ABN4APA1_EMTOG|nr:DUF4290 domain-containing protein [Emticicia oligotrophica]AFK04290.1 hypothetical protein Emtol_3157 [Emticicia oligotrophica DSM 17448]